KQRIALCALFPPAKSSPSAHPIPQQADVLRPLADRGKHRVHHPEDSARGPDSSTLRVCRRVPEWPDHWFTLLDIGPSHGIVSDRRHQERERNKWRQTMSLGLDREVTVPNVPLVETDGDPLESHWHVLQISLLSGTRGVPVPRQDRLLHRREYVYLL